MGVASSCGAFWGFVARPVFSGAPLGVLGAALGLGLHPENIAECAPVVAALVVAVGIAALRPVVVEDVVAKPLHLGGVDGFGGAGIGRPLWVLGCG